MGTKKEADNLLATLKELDKKMSLSFSLSASNNSPLGHLRPHMKLLEYSCHGLVWISGAMICLWLSMDPAKEAFFFNLLVALFLDIILVAVLKATLRRRRPSNNEDDDMFMTYSIDKMSCPSGHTSRAVLMALILITSSPHLYLLHPFFFVWCVCTCVSRVLLGRHFIGDVIIGVLLGYAEYRVMNCLWADADTAQWYLDLFGDSNAIVEDL